MNPIRVAILGQGRSGRDIHGYSLSKMPDQYKIVAVVDELEERRKRAEQEYKCQTYADYHQLMDRDDVDLVINALPSFQHVPVSLEFLERGFHVLSEKPLARKVTDVDLIIDAAKKSGKVMAVYQQSRFSPAFIKLREIIASGVLGRIVQVSIFYSGFARRWDWQTLKSMNGGNLLNTGPHPVDQALQLFGTDLMPEVICKMDRANSYGDAEDYVKIMLMGNNRPVIDVEISSCSAYPQFTYQVQATQGGLTGNLTHLDWKYFVPEDSADHQVISAPLQKEDGTPAYCSEKLIWHEASWDLQPDFKQDLFHTMALSYYDMLHKTITLGEPLKVKLEEVRQQIAVIETCFQQNPQFAI